MIEGEQHLIVLHLFCHGRIWDKHAFDFGFEKASERLSFCVYNKQSLRSNAFEQWTTIKSRSNSSVHIWLECVLFQYSKFNRLGAEL